MIAIVVVCVIAATAYVQYTKLMERTYERHASMSLVTIGAAEKIYQARHGDYWPGLGHPLESIEVTNEALGTNISDIPNTMAIICGGGEPGYQCRAFYTQGGQIKWTVESRATLLDGWPFCSYMDERCPTCKNYLNGGCAK